MMERRKVWITPNTKKNMVLERDHRQESAKIEFYLFLLSIPKHLDYIQLINVSI